MFGAGGTGDTDFDHSAILPPARSIPLRSRLVTEKTRSRGKSMRWIMGEMYAITLVMLHAWRPRSLATETRERSLGQTTPSRTQARPRKTKENRLGFSWIYLDSFVRFGVFQRVTGNPEREKIADPFVSVRGPRIKPQDGSQPQREPWTQVPHPNLAPSRRRRGVINVDCHKLRESARTNQGICGGPYFRLVPLLREAEYSSNCWSR